MSALSSYLRLITFNCHSLNHNREIIVSLLKSCDILCLQETLLYGTNNNLIYGLDANFEAAHVSASRSNDNFVGRCSGGLAILWRKSSNVKITSIEVSSRTLGLKLEVNGAVYLLLNVYCYCDYGNVQSLLDYKSHMAELSDFCSNENFTELIILGDMNADPHKGRFFREYESFIKSNSLNMSDITNLPGDSYTYISSNAQSSTSWLDHVALSNSELARNFKIMYGHTLYDHIPLYLEVVLPAVVEFPNIINTPPCSVQAKINWGRVYDSHKNEFASALDDYSLNVSSNVLICHIPNCDEGSHINDLEDLYSTITECLSVASLSLPQYRNNNKKYCLVGWNQYCKDLYAVARRKYLTWHSNGRIRLGEQFEAMRESRRQFKKALKFCRKNEQSIRKENLLSKFQHASKAIFWKEMRKINGTSNHNGVSIDGISDPGGIVDIFNDKYKLILDDAGSQSEPTVDSNGGNASAYSGNVPLITLRDVDASIDKLKESCGWDNIHSNLLKYSGPVFRNLLVKYFNKCLEHNYIPCRMLTGQIRPIIKSGSLSKTRSANYRPIMSSSLIFKTLEYCLLPILNKHLTLSNQQLGFRSGASCLSTVTLLRETAESYIKQGSKVHCATIDITKAFDKINSKLLVAKLSHTTLPRQVVDIIAYMYQNTFVNVRFNEVENDPWLIGNGTRQGSVLSPLLFCFYINEVIGEVYNMPCGCLLDGIKMNVLCYADDIALLAPSAKGLQKMLVTLQEGLTKLGLVVNPAKCAYIVSRKCSKQDDVASSVTILGHQIERVKSFKYLGIILTDDMSIKPDIDRALDAFLRQFNGVYSKFYYLDVSVLSFLFHTYTSSFYGAETWCTSGSARRFDKISIAYHKAVKKVAGLQIWDSNHEGCDIVKVPIFKHLLNKRMICFLHSLLNSCCNSISRFKYYFRYSSNYALALKSVFHLSYGIEDIFDNPLCALISRIQFVQNHEQRMR